MAKTRKCPKCRQTVGEDPHKPGKIAMHRPPDSQAMCKGSGGKF